ncbi:hypothetical protein [Paracoccus versutus]|uniref:hypothetical protein n=1 Tax=Paracoccus versutus TaxID=34007 RepID=UPI0011C07E6D|nr:hypothetical protein [Paracoccus versutus]
MPATISIVLLFAQGARIVDEKPDLDSAREAEVGVPRGLLGNGALAAIRRLRHRDRFKGKAGSGFSPAARGGIWGLLGNAVSAMRSVGSGAGTGAEERLAAGGRPWCRAAIPRAAMREGWRSRSISPPGAAWAWRGHPETAEPWPGRAGHGAPGLMRIKDGRGESG